MYLRYAALPHLYLLEPLTEHTIMGPLSSFAVQYLFQVPFYVFLICHIVLWCLLDYLMLRMLEVSYLITYSHFYSNNFQEGTFLRDWICWQLIC